MGIKNIAKITVFFCFLFLGFTLKGQNSSRIHQVKQGETLYGISRQYDLKPEDILRFNPEVKADGLKIGTKLLIPDPKSLSLAEEKEVEEKRDSSRYFYHTVSEGETLYSIAKQYDRSMASIELANPALQEGGLKAGMVLRIPKQKLQSEPSEEDQTTKADQKTGTEDITNADEDWFYHKVAVGQTAYSLSKKYSISLDSLYLLNPSAENGLRIDQWLKFPLNRKPKPKAKKQPFEGEVLQAEAPTAVQDTPKVSGSGNSKYFLYKVKAGDTFFSLKQRYFVEEEELIDLNPELKKGLEQGRYIIMPKKEESKELSWLEKLLKDQDKTPKDTSSVSDDTKAQKDALNEPDSLEPDSIDLPIDSAAIDSNERYTIGVILPFRAYLYSDTLDYRNFEAHRDSEMAMQFYLGLKMAADSLKKQGMNLKLRVYDSEGNTNRIKAIAADMEENEIDLVFGPAYSKNVEMLAEELPEVPIISPLSRAVEVANKPYLVQMVPPDEVRNQRIADLINDQYPQSKVFFAHCGTEEEKKQAQAIKAYLNPREHGFINNILDCEELQNSRSFSLGPKDSIAKVVILLSNKPVFTTDLVSKLYGLRDSTVVLVASPRVLNMPTMELHYLDALNYATYEVRNVNYKDSLTEALIMRFRAINEADAGPFALQGFDAAYYFLSNLWGLGPFMLDHLEPSLGRSTGFKFERIKDGGLENQYLFLSQMHDFKMHRIP